MFATPLDVLRRELLGVSGIGPETADAILLYAGGLPTFVVDAYTARVLRRHELIDGDATYDDIQSLFEDALPGEAAIFNEYHALLVRVAKTQCRPQARCDGCPLAQFPHDESL
jgi:endonuclease-3 related protein